MGDFHTDWTWNLVQNWLVMQNSGPQFNPNPITMGKKLCPFVGQSGDGEFWPASGGEVSVHARTADLSGSMAFSLYHQPSQWDPLWAVCGGQLSLIKMNSHFPTFSRTGATPRAVIANPNELSIIPEYHLALYTVLPANHVTTNLVGRTWWHTFVSTSETKGDPHWV